MNTYPDDTFLARWLSGELSPEELAAFERSEDYAKLTQVMEATKGLQNHPFEGEKILGKVKAKIAKEKVQKVIEMRRGRRQVWYAAAAVVVLLIVGAWFFTQNTSPIPSQTYATAVGEQKIETFADGTRITLNSESQIDVAIVDAQQERTVKIIGEAFFEVAKGNRFAVEMNLGEVLVVGTAFNILSQDNGFTVTCYEGKVEVQQAKATQILIAGEQYTFTKGAEGQKSTFPMEEKAETPSSPRWTAPATVLEEITNRALIDTMEKKLRVTIEPPASFEPRFIWSRASFSHKNLQSALNSSPLAADYTWEIRLDEKKIILSPRK
ncbi:MAG: FecR domain-containing protein [Bacteroidota bacterium]